MNEITHYMTITFCLSAFIKWRSFTLGNYRNKYLGNNCALFLGELQLQSTQHTTFDVCHVHRLWLSGRHDHKTTIVFCEEQEFCLKGFLEARLVGGWPKFLLIFRWSFQEPNIRHLRRVEEKNVIQQAQNVLKCSICVDTNDLSILPVHCHATLSWRVEHCVAYCQNGGAIWQPYSLKGQNIDSLSWLLHIYFNVGYKNFVAHHKKDNIR